MRNSKKTGFKWPRASDLFLIFMACTVGWWTPRFRWWVSRSLGWVIFHLFRFRRWTLFRNLALAFPEKTLEEREKIARLSVDNQIYNFFEFWSLFWVSHQSSLKKKGNLLGREHFEEARAKGKGVLILSLHLGHGDVGISLLSLKGIYCHLISKKFKVQWLNEAWFGLRERLGSHFIDPHGPKIAFEILGACRRGEGVIFVMDQFMASPYGIKTTFFGHPTGTAYGLGLFALKTGAPVIPLYTYRDKDLRTHLVFGPEIPTQDLIQGQEGLERGSGTENRDALVQALTQRFNHEVERLIRLHPEQWMWIHRRWKRWR